MIESTLLISFTLRSLLNSGLNLNVSHKAYCFLLFLNVFGKTIYNFKKTS